MPNTTAAVPAPRGESAPPGPSAPSGRSIDPLVLLLALVALACVATWLLPAGVYTRAADPRTGLTMVVSGSYHLVARTPSVMQKGPPVARRSSLSK